MHEEVDAVVPDDAVARKDGDRDLFLDLEARAAERAGERGAQDFFRDVPSEVPRALVHEGFDFRGEWLAAHCGHGMGRSCEAVCLAFVFCCGVFAWGLCLGNFSGSGLERLREKNFGRV